MGRHTLAMVVCSLPTLNSFSMYSIHWPPLSIRIVPTIVQAGRLIETTDQLSAPIKGIGRHELTFRRGLSACLWKKGNVSSNNQIPQRVSPKGHNAACKLVVRLDCMADIARTRIAAGFEP